MYQWYSIVISFVSKLLDLQLPPPPFHISDSHSQLRRRRGKRIVPSTTKGDGEGNTVLRRSFTPTGLFFSPPSSTSLFSHKTRCGKEERERDAERTRAFTLYDTSSPFPSAFHRPTEFIHVVLSFHLLPHLWQCGLYSGILSLSLFNAAAGRFLETKGGNSRLLGHFLKVDRQRRIIFSWAKIW